MTAAGLVVALLGLVLGLLGAFAGMEVDALPLQLGVVGAVVAAFGASGYAAIRAFPE